MSAQPHVGFAVINERTWFPEDLGVNSEFAPNCYPCHRTVPVWSMAQQSTIAVSNGICNLCLMARHSYNQRRSYSLY
ncbi:hypothetical protein L1D15_07465 [Vibrio sp. Isolate25]|uniref:hypothetical protein n=1 Tax=Vibrio sp. Isolate25 TaxID=2908535 RepID=UPI001EFE27C1|nr:hypothetical protein [Vibrio sp. Isolate25]MCG9596564.1 hypothetical protein [Vibrio sp. Isolate25]